MDTLVVTALALAGLVVVLLALRRDTPLDRPGPALPAWDPLPDRSDLARVDWPLRIPGYDPATVEQTFDLLADAYADLLAEADPATVARARRRAVTRLERLRREAAVDPGPAGRGAADRGAADPAAADPAQVAAGRDPAEDGHALDHHDGLTTAALGTPAGLPEPDTTQEALRAAAVLAVLRRDDGRR